MSIRRVASKLLDYGIMPKGKLKQLSLSVDSARNPEGQSAS